MHVAVQARALAADDERCSARTTGESLPVRYSVILMARTAGSSAAASMKLTTGSKDS